MLNDKVNELINSKKIIFSLQTKKEIFFKRSGK